MPIRPLALLDLPQLYRFRDDAIGLDTARVLTRGNPLGAGGVLSYMNPVRHIYSAVANGDEAVVLGGIIHTRNETFARLLYLAPTSQLHHPHLPELIDNLTSHAGAWGAFHVIAEVDEKNGAFVPLRKSGFSVYAWQRMWEMPRSMNQDSVKNARVEHGRNEAWSRLRSVSLPAVQNLYHQIVPPLLHPIEAQPRLPLGWLSNDGAKCYVSVTHGVYGIVLTPLIHPDAIDVGFKLAAIIHHLPDIRNRPVYVCVRSYQAWLEPVLADLGAKPGPRQAVMVKHLARLVKEPLTSPAVPTNVSIQPSRVSQIEGKK